MFGPGSPQRLENIENDHGTVMETKKKYLNQKPKSWNVVICVIRIICNFVLNIDILMPVLLTIKDELRNSLFQYMFQRQNTKSGIPCSQSWEIKMHKNQEGRRGGGGG